MLDYMDELAKLWDDALVDAAESRAFTEKVNSKNTSAKMSIRSINGEKVVWIDDDITKTKPKNVSLENHVKQYIENQISANGTFIGTLPDSGMRVYAERKNRTPLSKYGLAEEYVRSTYTQWVRDKQKNSFRAKMKAAGVLDDLVSIANGRKWEKTKHQQNKDAKYGVYIYNSNFAFPVYNNAGDTVNVRAYDCQLVVLNASDGRKYLYDVKEIKENTARANDILLSERQRAAKMAARQGDVSEKTISQSSGNVKKSRRDTEGNELSQQQQEFFKDSKVRDDEGNLVVVYHSTDADFTVFDKDKLGSITDFNAMDVGLAATSHIGFWFNTSDLRGKTYQSNVLAGYLDVKRLYHAGTLENLVNQILEHYGEDYNELQDRFETGEITVSKELGEYFTGWLESEGYDGIEVDDTEFGGTSYVVFNSNQFKNVDNKNPTSNPDIRFSRRDNAEGLTKEEARAQAAAYTRLKAENAELRRRVEYWKGQTQRTKQATVRQADVNRFSRQLIKRYGSTADQSYIRQALQEMGDYLVQNNGEALDFACRSRTRNKVIDTKP